MKIKSFFLLGVITLIMASCSSYKQVPYLQDPAVVNAIAVIDGGFLFVTFWHYVRAFFGKHAKVQDIDPS